MSTIKNLGLHSRTGIAKTGEMRMVKEMTTAICELIILFHFDAEFHKVLYNKQIRKQL